MPRLDISNYGKTERHKKTTTYELRIDKK